MTTFIVIANGTHFGAVDEVLAVDVEDEDEDEFINLMLQDDEDAAQALVVREVAFSEAFTARKALELGDS